MASRVDLHLHTTCSDGLKSPEDIIKEVKRKNLTAFAITDHDSIKGFLEARDLLGENDPELVPGLELSCSSVNGDLHILAYLFDPDSEALKSALEEFRIRRNQRGYSMVKRLNEMGIEISYEDVLEAAGTAAVGRPHVAEALARRKAVPSYNDAFQKYIGDGRPAYVPKQNFTPREAINMIHKAGGLAVLAHPMVSYAHERIEELVGLGLDGIEALHPDHKQAECDRLKVTARRFRLVWTGGSDYHGRGNRTGSVGSEKVPIDCLDEMKARVSQKRGSD